MSYLNFFIVLLASNLLISSCTKVDEEFKYQEAYILYVMSNRIGLKDSEIIRMKL